MIYYLHDCIPTTSPLGPCSRILTMGRSAVLRCLFRMTWYSSLGMASPSILDSVVRPPRFEHREPPLT